MASGDGDNKGSSSSGSSGDGSGVAARPLTIWLTGLSGSGKSTVAAGLAQRFAARGIAHFCLDGDVLRTGLCRDLGFSAADRHENIRRVAEVARLFNQAGLQVICSLISPLGQDREMARTIIGADSFVEVHLSAPLAVCEQRDPKGLYRRARSGGIAEFTGISAPYEVPSRPALRLDSSRQSIKAAVQQLWELWAAWPEAQHTLD